ncbi:MAG: tetratricopeptide repeat-containing sensor histidine kinase [Chitinophagaceae bacterium]|nr:tetratricopeptide repeat-containing sensor histidine kinase [Chitinophagaceae bacterium]
MPNKFAIVKRLLWLMMAVNGPFAGMAQLTDTLAVNLAYERLHLLPEDKADSLPYYAQQIEQFSKANRYTRGLAYAYRLWGISAEYREDTKAAVDYYLRFRRSAEALGDTVLIASAISDAAGIYAKLKQFNEAKQNYLAYIQLLEPTGSRQKLAKGYSNLGVTYRRENRLDSAYYWYRQALAIRQQLNDSAGIATVHNNLASLLLYQQKPDAAFTYIKANLEYHLRTANTEDQWFDYCNLASVYMQKENWPMAQAYADTALAIARRLQSTSKEADTYEVLKELYYNKGNFALAYSWQQQEMDLRSTLLNAENNAAIAALREAYGAEKKEQQNRLLSAELRNEQLAARNYLLALGGVLLLALLIGLGWWQARRQKRRTEAQNAYIQKQNNMLAELNADKNALISIVSHDLAGPLSEIGLWQKVLLGGRATFATEQQRQAIERIGQAVKNGEQLIRRILDVEKAETNRHVVQLEEIRVGALLEHAIQPYLQKAQEKQIVLKTQIDASLEWMTDRQIFERIADNLLSNALKFTPPGKNVTISLAKDSASLVLTIADEGAGIAPDELPYLFTKYARISNKPTHGESSTGLGLSIVKRLADELGAEVKVKSTPGEGSTFWVVFN